MAESIQKYITEGTPERTIVRYESLPERTACADYGEFDRNIVVLDTETTGISMRKDELTQIAAARMENGQIVDWFVTFVNPGRPIPDDVAHLTDIHDEDVADAPDPATALEQLVEFVGDAKIVAHNASFDRNFTTKHPAGYPLLENLWIDSLELARIALPRMRSHRLIDLVRAFDAPLSTHRADEDVSATCALYRLLLAGVEAMPASLVAEVARLAPPTEWPTGAVFAYFARRISLEKGDAARSQAALDQSKMVRSPTASDQSDMAVSQDASNQSDIEELQAASGPDGSPSGESGPIAPFNLKAERAQVAQTIGKPKRDAAKLISAELAARSGVRISETIARERDVREGGNGEQSRISSDTSCTVRSRSVSKNSEDICCAITEHHITEAAEGPSTPCVSTCCDMDENTPFGDADEIAPFDKAEEYVSCETDEDNSRGEANRDANYASHEDVLCCDVDEHVSCETSALPTENAAAMDNAAAMEDAAAMDNEAAQVLRFPTRNDIEAAFSDTGLVGALYEDYQQRDEQLQMALGVRDAFATSDNLVVEAGTGVGKSMAYLVPAALTALENNINVGVATKTNALLDQLIYHELPALAAAVKNTQGRTLTYAALKGFTHYPCLRKIQRVARDGARMVAVQGEEQTQAPAIAALLSFVQQTDYDDMDSLKIDYRLLPRRAITSTSHECMRRKCPFYGAPCFVHGQRRRAEAADVVVTNHSLLFCDIAADNGLLPPIRYWVVDEAHSAEAEARRALSLELSVDAMNQLAERVSSDGTRNLFTRAERTVTGPPATDANGDPTTAAAEADFGTLFFGLCAKAKAAGAAFSEAEREFASHVSELLFFDTQKRSSYEFVDLWINDEMRRSTIFGTLADHARILIEATEKLVNACQELVGYLEGAQGAATIQREIATTAFELKDIITAADTIFVQAPPTYVYSATLPRKTDRGGAKLCAQLYNVGARLDETLYVNTHSVVFASATLTVAGSFKPFEEAMGLNTSPQSHATTLALGSPFDFDANMTIYVPNDLPEPNTSGYLEAIQQLLCDAHLAQQGSMLTLFTNRKEMDACYAEVAPALKAADLRLVCQRWGVSVKGLRDDFLADHALSLFALKSFWEGFDAPGSTLRGVVLPKLPFSKPSDPLSCERAARDDAAWRKWVLPQSVLEVKQAVGRLLRKADDRGIVVLADSRLLSKSYGKTFLSSLPSKDIRVMSTQQMIREIEDRAVQDATREATRNGETVGAGERTGTVAEHVAHDNAPHTARPTAEGVDDAGQA